MTVLPPLSGHPGQRAWPGPGAVSVCQVTTDTPAAVLAVVWRTPVGILWEPACSCSWFAQATVVDDAQHVAIDHARAHLATRLRR